MSVKLSQIIKKIEEVYPRSLALEWDNPGLICGHRDKSIETVMLALDADNRTTERAAGEHADLLITHHPLIFASVKQVNDDNALGRKLLALIENGIACYAMHTNFDIAEGGMADSVAKRLSMRITAPLEITAASEGGNLGIGFIAELEEPQGLTASELAEYVKTCFKLDKAWYYDAGRRIHRVAVCPGSGKGMLKEVIASGADAFITGDTGHHDGIDYKDEDITLIDVGHYGLEHIFADVMYDFLTDYFPELKLIKEMTDERKFI